MSRTVIGLLAIGLTCCSALQLGTATSRPTIRPRASPIRLESTEELSAEQIKAAAEKASEPGQMAWPESKAPTPGNEPVMSREERGEAEGFDPRVILYVSLPALVLVGQLFFTFSRDALGDVALGPAVMDLYVPPGM